MAAHAVARLRHTLSVELGADTSLRHFRNVSWHQELGFGRGETETGSADSLDQRTLRYEVDLQGTRHHLLLGRRAEPYMADDGFAKQFGTD